MSKHPTIIIATVIFILSVFTVYIHQNNSLSMSQINSELNNIQVRVNRGFNSELPELDDDQRQALEQARQQIWDARLKLIETQQEVGLLTEQEGQYFRDHLELMAKYDQDYDPPAWGFGMMGPGNMGMMGRSR